MGQLQGRHEVVRRRQRLEALMDRISGAGLDAELTAHYSRYLSVLVSGYAEQSVKELVLEYSRTKSNHQIQRYVGKQVGRLRNIDLEKLKQLIESFDVDWWRELEDMFTVRRLGVDGRLALTLTTTNPIESMISVSRTVMGRVKRWKDGSMKKRWVAAGMLEAERSFRRVKGCKEMPTLVAALRRHAGVPVTPHEYDEEAA